MWTCTLVLVAWLVGSAYSQPLSGPGLGPEHLHPWNSSGYSVISLQWLSVRAPFLTTVWTLVALSSVLGKQQHQLKVFVLCSLTEIFLFHVLLTRLHH